MELMDYIDVYKPLSPDSEIFHQIDLDMCLVYNVREINL